MSEKATTPPEVARLALANDALLEAPIYEKHHRGANWLAVIDIDKTMPSGLSRRWMPRGRGECLYGTEQLTLFDPVEFGADYTSYAGKKTRDRWYGVVLAKTESYLLIEKCPSGARAVLRATEAKSSREDRLRALQEERDNLVDRAAKVEGEIQEIASAPIDKVPNFPEGEDMDQRKEILLACMAEVDIGTRGFSKEAEELFWEKLGLGNYPHAFGQLQVIKMHKKQNANFLELLAKAKGMLFQNNPASTEERPSNG